MEGINPFFFQLFESIVVILKLVGWLTNSEEVFEEN
jgi:hypothetical protein